MKGLPGPGDEREGIRSQAYFEKLADCVHCGKPIYADGKAGECEHGIAHLDCVADNGCSS